MSTDIIITRFIMMCYFIMFHCLNLLVCNFALLPFDAEKGRNSRNSCSVKKDGLFGAGQVTYWVDERAEAEA